jgi:rRNA maturation endonuclease Nob1
MCKHNRPRYACGHEGEITSTEYCDWQKAAQELLGFGIVRDPKFQHRILTWKRICETQSTTVNEEQSEKCARCGREKAREEVWEAEEKQVDGEEKLRIE